MLENFKSNINIKRTSEVLIFWFTLKHNLDAVHTNWKVKGKQNIQKMAHLC